MTGRAHATIGAWPVPRIGWVVANVREVSYNCWVRQNCRVPESMKYSSFVTLGEV